MKGSFLCQQQFLTSFWQVWSRGAGLCSCLWLPREAGVSSRRGTEVSEPETEPNCCPTECQQTSFHWCCLTGEYTVSKEGYSVQQDPIDTWSINQAILIECTVCFYASFPWHVGLWSVQYMLQTVTVFLCSCSSCRKKMEGEVLQTHCRSQRFPWNEWTSSWLTYIHSHVEIECEGNKSTLVKISKRLWFWLNFG